MSENGKDDGLCGEGLLLPIFDERGWHPASRATIYFIALVYTFLGIAVIMDIFMTSILVIINTKQTVYELRPELPEWMARKKWNETVAGLTVMALGVSAPEILLSIIEVVGHGFKAGYLGPGTIVGNCAINILVLAFCVVAVPKGEVRRIIHYRVFLVTGFFHLFSYLWLYLVLAQISPGVVEIWEGVVTLLLFPLMVVSAYAANKNCWSKIVPHRPPLKGDEAPKEFVEFVLGSSCSISKEGIITFVKEILNYPGMTVQDAAVLVAAKMTEADQSAMWYRVGGARVVTSGRPVTHHLDAKLEEVYKLLKERGLSLSLRETAQSEAREGTLSEARQSLPHEMTAFIEFEAPFISVTESEVTFPVFIIRSGNLEESVSVRVVSVDGKAIHGEDYDPINEIITFRPGQTRAYIMIRIIDEDKYEPTEDFFLRLSKVKQEASVKIGKVHIMEIKIIQEKNPGTVEWEKRGMAVKENEGQVEAMVLRKRGTDGTVSVSWSTHDDTAVAGVDYEAGEGIVVFYDGEVKRAVNITIYNTMSEEKDVEFHVKLEKPTGGAMLGKIKQLRVIVTDVDDTFDMDNFIFMANINVDAFNIFRSTWCQQIKDAMLPNGGRLEETTNVDYLLHFLFFFWKVILNLLIPPPNHYNGWPTFFISIVVVGLIAALAADCASIFGCSVGLHDTFTAMTFVSIGTSLTDAIACRLALRNSKSADIAIGNFNGSAAVNVYFGLGLPWLLSAIYHTVKGGQFTVSSEGLGYVVGLYAATAILTLVILILRRKLIFFGKAEVGGPNPGRAISVVLLVVLWSTYIGVCYFILESY